MRSGVLSGSRRLRLSAAPRADARLGSHRHSLLELQLIVPTFPFLFAGRTGADQVSLAFEGMNGIYGSAAQEALAKPSFEESLTRLDALAILLDSAVRIPGTNVVVGLDALLGLVPVIGDAISGAIASYIIWEARRLGAPRWLIARMAANTTFDTLLGSIPVLGDVFDVAYQSNLKNVALLRRHAEKHGQRYGRAIETTYMVN